MKRYFRFWLSIFFIALSGCGNTSTVERQYPETYTNSELIERPDINSLLSVANEYLFAKRPLASPVEPIPIDKITPDQLVDETKNVVYRLGHSTVLMKIEGKLILTDPMFSERASPTQIAGPKRFHPVPITIAELPTVDVVVISHDHYDHLDESSIAALAEKTNVFLVPLKIKPYLVDWGVRPEKIIELEWWKSVNVGNINFVFTPAQHFSGRGVLDRDSTLWGGWAVLAKSARIFFSGDSGYFTGFKKIGRKYGPFDLTLIETGAYNIHWPFVHMFPEQSVAAHIDVRGKVMMPVHNCTFDLSVHDWNEPLIKALQLGREKGVAVAIPKIGERFEIGKTPDNDAWWY
ncbi:MBL fold metallo-hydrolase [Veronia pacifica]|uniref:Hydrolase n=1 Tax=Veronia pacifica TaxID=1080227 RepID=A0A1C3EBK0_9GAMM|nr:MBL fold metallo-hydrolase [Veronia pacifica]ODA30605.1 hydrolase [Veronia pacifica]